MVEYKDILEKIVASDDESTNQVYGIIHAVDKKDTEIREHEMEMARIADKKDTEKKEFNRKVLGTASFVVLTAVGTGNDLDKYKGSI